MTDIIDTSYFDRLNNSDPAIICRNERARYDPGSATYFLDLWQNTLAICPEKRTVTEHHNTSSPLHYFFHLLALYYLLQKIEVRLDHQWISEKDLPGGPTFFRGPHLVPTQVIAARFQNELDDFEQQCTLLGGTPLTMADSAFRFTMTRDIVVALLYWRGDDDFPAEAKILYDRSIEKLLTLDMVFTLAYGICHQFAAT